MIHFIYLSSASLDLLVTQWVYASNNNCKYEDWLMVMWLWFVLNSSAEQNVDCNCLVSLWHDWCCYLNTFGSLWKTNQMSSKSHKSHQALISSKMSWRNLIMALWLPNDRKFCQKFVECLQNKSKRVTGEMKIVQFHVFVPSHNVSSWCD